VKVWVNQILGLIAGIFLGGVFGSSLELLGTIVLFLAIVSIIFRRNLMKGPLWGFAFGLLVGYSFRPYLAGSLFSA
jgi:hypothetical protein